MSASLLDTFDGGDTEEDEPAVTLKRSNNDNEVALEEGKFASVCIHINIRVRICINVLHAYVYIHIFMYTYIYVYTNVHSYFKPIE
jgi:hypothetical protein